MSRGKTERPEDQGSCKKGEQQGELPGFLSAAALQQNGKTKQQTAKQQTT